MGRELWSDPDGSALEISRIDAALAAALPVGSLHAVGGRVRDEVRTEVDGVARPAKDLDYVVLGLEGPELLRRLSTIGRADLVGAAFAVVKLTLGGTTVDVALPRREQSTGTGHRDFFVEAGPGVPLEDDLGRRDFRMNMLARALPDGRLVDPYGGADDIRARRIALLRPRAFLEDPLRMLRACQFAARFEFTIETLTADAMRSAAALIATVSAERVRDELSKLLGAGRPSLGVEWMRKGGILQILLPELLEGWGVEQNEFHAYDVYHHNLATADAAPQDDETTRWAALLHDIGKPRTKDGPHFYRHEIVGEAMARIRLDQLRLPGEVTENICSLVRYHMYATDDAQSNSAVRRFIRRIGPERVDQQFALRHADIAGSGLPKRGPENERFEARVREQLSFRPPLSVKGLPIDGQDVIEAAIALKLAPVGWRGGPLIGRALEAALERVLDCPALSRMELLEALPGIIRKMVDPEVLGPDVSQETTSTGSPTEVYRGEAASGPELARDALPPCDC